MKPALLFIEDDIVQSSIIKSYLDTDFDTYHVTDCLQAQSLLQQRQFDIVLTDYMLPEMNGIQFIRFLKESYEHIPAVLLTSSNNVRTAFEALRLGAYDFLSKDIGNCFLDLLCPILNRALNQHQINLNVSDAVRLLAEEKNTAHEVCDSMSQGILIIGSDGFISYSNLYFKDHLLPLFDGALEIGVSLEVFLQAIMLKQSAAPSEFIHDIGSLLNELQNPATSVEIVMGCFYYEVSLKKLSNSSYAVIFKDLTEQRLEISALHSILSQSPLPIVTADSSGEILFANKMAADLIELDLKHLIGCNLHQFFKMPSVALDPQYLKTTSSQQRFERQNLMTFQQNSIPVDIAVTTANILNRQHFLFSFVDISSTIESEQRLLEAYSLTESIIASSPLSIVATDKQGKILAVSPALERLLHWSKDELVQHKNMIDFIDQQELQQRTSDLISGSLDEDALAILAAQANQSEVESWEWRCQKKDGSLVPVSITASVLKSVEGVVSGYVFILMDITEQKKAQAYMKHIAHHDELTGLPNRTLMRDRILNNLARVKRYGEKFAILLIDLDHFKRVNDTLGHMAGDDLLKQLSRRMIACLRESDTVCRIGGDEFVVILNDVQKHEDIETTVNKIITAVSQPVMIGQNRLLVTFSLGVSIAPEHSTDIDDLLRYADIAMYAAKNKGRNNFQFFSFELEHDSLQKMYVEQSLYKAFEQHQLVMYYQPQIEASSGKVVGYESLIRWQSPERGLIYPDEFLATAENSGFIIPLGEWILRQSIHDIQNLSQRDGFQYKLAVNVSARQFDRDDFADRVIAIVQELNFPSDQLQIEITESVLLHKSEQSLNHFLKLKQHQISIALDDFGTGYSSLSYITHYPIDTLKIDRTFMDFKHEKNKTVVSAVAAIAKSMNLQLVAEGVENLEQYDFVKNIGVQRMQGFFYAKPRSYDQIIANVI